MATKDKAQRRRITLLDLLNELQAEGPHSEQALVALVIELIRSERVVLGGNFAGERARFG